MANALLEMFRRSCGLTGPLELTVVRPETGFRKVYSLDQPFALLGRGPLNDVILDDPMISQRHVYLQAIHGRVAIIDLGSRTGVTFPVGKRSHAWMEVGSTYYVGPFEITLDACPTIPGNFIPDEYDDPLTARPEEGDTAGGVTLEIQSGSSDPIYWPMSLFIAMIGRASLCAVRCADESLSNFRCSLINTPDGVWIVDLLSPDGTRVNGRTIRVGRLKDGDIVRAGKLSIVIRQGVFSSPIMSSSSAVSLATPRTSPSHQGGNQALAATSEKMAESFGMVFAPMQQMFEQFQQCMSMMMRMFSTMQSEQIAMMREQMTQLQQVAVAMKEMRSEMNHIPVAETLQIPEAELAPIPPAPVPVVINFPSYPGGPTTTNGTIPITSNNQVPIATTNTFSTVQSATEITLPKPMSNFPDPVPQVAAAPSPRVPTPKTVDPAVAQKLANAHAWLSQRLAAMEKDAGKNAG